MLQITLILLVSTAYCAKLDKTYLPPGASSSGGDGSILSVPMFDQTPGSGVISTRNNVYSSHSSISNQPNGGRTSSFGSGQTQARFTSQSHLSHQSSSFGSSSQYGNNQYSGQSGSGSFQYGNQGSAYSQNREQVPILKYSNENNYGQYKYE